MRMMQSRARLYRYLLQVACILGIAVCAWIAGLLAWLGRPVRFWFDRDLAGLLATWATFTGLNILALRRTGISKAWICGLSAIGCAVGRSLRPSVSMHWHSFLEEKLNHPFGDCGDGLVVAVPALLLLMAVTAHACWPHVFSSE
jgi:hypothetical protein